MSCTFLEVFAFLQEALLVLSKMLKEIERASE
jgi:hypothetical protein